MNMWRSEVSSSRRRRTGSSAPMAGSSAAAASPPAPFRIERRASLATLAGQHIAVEAVAGGQEHGEAQPFRRLPIARPDQCQRRLVAGEADDAGDDHADQA